MIADPGAIGAAILLVADAQGDWAGISIVIGAMLLIVLIATQVQKLLGVTGLQVVSRVVGVLPAALAVQFIFDGISDSSMFGALTQS